MPIMSYPDARNLSTHAAGVRFYVVDPEVLGSDFDPDEELTYDTLAFCVRDHMGDDARGYSDAELWADVIVPHIAAGRIEHATWGAISTI